MAWATEGEALALTGVAVSAAQLAQAQGVVDLFSGISEDNATQLSSSNVRMLRAAVAYQAAWMLAQVDVTSRTDVASIDQDGAKFTPGHPDALILAPLARRALARLSWAGKSFRLVQPTRQEFASVGAWQDAWLRDATSDNWRPTS